MDFEEELQSREYGEASKEKEPSERASKSKILSFDGVNHCVHLACKFTEQDASKIAGAYSEEGKGNTNTENEKFDIRIMTTNLDNSEIKK